MTDPVKVDFEDEPSFPELQDIPVPYRTKVRAKVEDSHPSIVSTVQKTSPVRIWHTGPVALVVVRVSAAFDLGVISSLGCQSCAGSGKQVVRFVDEHAPMPSWVTNEERPCQPCGGTGIWAWEKEVAYHAGQTISGLKRIPKRRLRGVR